MHTEQGIGMITREDKDSIREATTSAEDLDREPEEDILRILTKEFGFIIKELLGDGLKDSKGNKD